MTQDARDEQKLAADRRAFLQQCGRFAVVTPPVVSLMLAVGDKGVAQALAASPGENDKKDKTQTTTATTSMSVSSLPTTLTKVELMHPGTKPDTNLAMVIDSMGLMKIG